MSAAKDARRYRAGAATYPGDCRSIVGEAKGPTTFGTRVAASTAAYDESANTTRVDFLTLAEGDYLIRNSDGTVGIGQYPAAVTR